MLYGRRQQPDLASELSAGARERVLFENQKPSAICWIASSIQGRCSRTIVSLVSRSASRALWSPRITRPSSATFQISGLRSTSRLARKGTAESVRYSDTIWISETLTWGSVVAWYASTTRDNAGAPASMREWRAEKAFGPDNCAT